MYTKAQFESILCKYPELISPGLTVRERDFVLYGQTVDILAVDKYKKRFAIQVRVSPIASEHAAEIISHQNAILSGDAPDVSMLVVSDKIPPHLQKTFEHNGIAWKEISEFQVREHLAKKNDDMISGF